LSDLWQQEMADDSRSKVKWAWSDGILCSVERKEEKCRKKGRKMQSLD